jgi:hypothetical protein
MTYYYVKTGGTATSSAAGTATPKTGSWATAFSSATEYFASIASLNSNVAINEADIVCVSNTVLAADNILTGSTTYGNSNNTIALVSVSDTAVDTAAYGAQAKIQSTTSSTTCNIRFGEVVGINFIGYTQTPASYYVIPNFYGKKFINCTFSLPESGAQLSYYNFLNNYGATFVNCSFVYGSSATTSSIRFPSFTYYGPREFYGCTFTGPTSSSEFFLYLTYTPCYFFNCDFGTNMPSRPLFATGTQVADIMHFHKCNLSSANYNTSSMLTFAASNNDRASIILDKSYIEGVLTSFRKTYLFAYLEKLTSVYRSDGAKDESNNNFSFKLTTSASLSTANKYTSIPVSSLWASTTSSKVITLEFAQDNAATALTYKDIEIYAIHGSLVDRNSYGSNPIGIETNVGTSTATWTGLTNPTKQKISITTSNTGGTDGILELYVSVKKSSTTIYLCPKVTIS